MPVAALLLLAVAGSGQGASLEGDLSEAESRVASAEREVAAAETRAEGARDGYAAAARRAESPAAAARAAQAELRKLRTDLRLRLVRAKRQIAALETAHSEAVDEHDEDVAEAAGFGLAALLAAAVALGWGRFRAGAAVMALTRIDRVRALALCLGGGLLLLVTGVLLMDAGGLARALGAFLFWSGLVLPTALLLGRHSAEVQHGHARPLLKRERLPAWVSHGTAALMLVLALLGLGAALFAEEPEAKPVPAGLQENAAPLTSGPGAAGLAEAEVEATAARQAAAKPLADRQAARVGLRRATRELRAAEALLADAEAEERRSTRRLAAQVAREEREAAREEARAEREAEELAEEESNEVVPSGCDPNYSGCVPPYPPDADCDEVGETVTVLGEDPHGLDADGDLVGCE
ncbi:MAG TPA: hypothetical protein VFY48_01485 [Solirubrobacterales bacterium]|nr:hypothetical protein [Solirubrobacterales bacterium]